MGKSGSGQMTKLRPLNPLGYLGLLGALGCLGLIGHVPGRESFAWLKSLYFLAVLFLLFAVPNRQRVEKICTPLYRISVREQDGLFVWCFGGHFQFDSRFTTALRNSMTEIEVNVPTSAPILIDVSRMRYVHRESLDYALCYGALLCKKGHHAAVLIDPTNPRMLEDISYEWRDAPIAIFEERESALIYLRNPGQFRPQPMDPS